MVTERDIKAIADEIAAKFKPQKIILFGSHARGTPREDSDIDFLVVLPMDAPRRKVAGRIRAALTGKFPIDVIVRTPAEFAVSSEDMIVKVALESGRELYSAAA